MFGERLFAVIIPPHWLWSDLNMISHSLGISSKQRFSTKFPFCVSPDGKSFLETLRWEASSQPVRKGGIKTATCWDVSVLSVIKCELILKCALTDSFVVNTTITHHFWSWYRKPVSRQLLIYTSKISVSCVSVCLATVGPIFTLFLPPFLVSTNSNW